MNWQPGAHNPAPHLLQLSPRVPPQSRQRRKPALDRTVQSQSGLDLDCASRDVEPESGARRESCPSRLQGFRGEVNRDFGVRKSSGVRFRAPKDNSGELRGRWKVVPVIPFLPLAAFAFWIGGGPTRLSAEGGLVLTITVLSQVFDLQDPLVWERRGGARVGNYCGGGSRGLFISMQWRRKKRLQGILNSTRWDTCWRTSGGVS